MRHRIDPTYLERTAIHEAGHAVVASLSSRLPAVKSLCLNPKGGGFCSLDVAQIRRTDDASGLIRQSIRVCAAGMLTEILAFGRLARAPFVEVGPDGEQGDAHKMAYLAGMLVEHARPRVDAELDVAEFLLRSRWGAVDLVARKLLECGSLPGEFVRHLIDVAPQRTKPSATPEADIELMSRAGAADPALGAAMVKALKAA